MERDRERASKQREAQRRGGDFGCGQAKGVWVELGRKRDVLPAALTRCRPLQHIAAWCLNLLRVAEWRREGDKEVERNKGRE